MPAPVFVFLVEKFAKQIVSFSDGDILYSLPHDARYLSASMPNISQQRVNRSANMPNIIHSDFVRNDISTPFLEYFSNLN